MLPTDFRMKIKTTYIILFAIVAIASILRLWKLGDVPISPDWDEAALGYNAYSIMQTGRDEYGEFLPIVLRSFDDYKPALYAYLTMPFIKMFDLTVFSVRFPSAIFGILTIIMTYFLVKELFKGRNYQDFLALLSSFLLAISPWHIQFSRIAFESNVGVAFNTLAVLFFLVGLKKPLFLVLSSITMGLSLYVYQSEKVFVPILAFLMIIIFRKDLFLLPKKYIATAFVLGFFIVLPITHYILTNKEALSRAQDVSILANKMPILEENVQRLVEDRKNNDYIGLIFDNRRVTYLKDIAAGYLSHFDLNWLFIKGDIARHHTPNMGLFYIIELPFLLIGVYKLLFGEFSKKTKLLIFSWFLIAPIPASVTSDVPHAVRALNFLPIFQIFTAIGVLFSMQKISNIQFQISNIPPSLKLWRASKYFKFLIVVFIFSFFVFNFIYYLNQYFIQQNYFHAKYWQYGYEETVEYLMSVRENYNKIIVSNKMPMDQSYIFFLFYSKYDPVKYLAEGGTKSGAQKESGNKFLNFEFRKFSYYTEKGDNMLLVGSSNDFTEIFKTIKRVDYPNGEVAIRIVHKD